MSSHIKIAGQTDPRSFPAVNLLCTPPSALRWPTHWRASGGLQVRLNGGSNANIECPCSMQIVKSSQAQTLMSVMHPKVQGRHAAGVATDTAPATGLLEAGIEKRVFTEMVPVCTCIDDGVAAPPERRLCPVAEVCRLKPHALYVVQQRAQDSVGQVAPRLGHRHRRAPLGCGLPELHMYNPQQHGHEVCEGKTQSSALQGRLRKKQC